MRIIDMALSENVNLFANEDILDAKNRNVLSSIKEGDSPVIVKYYF